jgi:hypothetical protein
VRIFFITVGLWFCAAHAVADLSIHNENALMGRLVYVLNGPNLNLSGQREPFRHHSYVSLAATGVIASCGTQGYELALRRVAGLLDEQAVR